MDETEERRKCRITLGKRQDGFLELAQIEHYARVDRQGEETKEYSSHDSLGLVLILSSLIPYNPEDEIRTHSAPKTIKGVVYSPLESKEFIRFCKNYSERSQSKK